MSAVHVEETSLRVHRKNHWIHVFAPGGIALKLVHPSRGCEAIEAIGILRLRRSDRSEPGIDFGSPQYWGSATTPN